MIKLTRKISILFFTIFIFSGLLKWFWSFIIDPTIVFGLLSLIFLLFNKIKIVTGIDKYMKFFLLFSTWLLFSVTYSLSDEYVYDKVFRYILIIYSFLYFFFAIRQKSDISFFLNCLFFIGLILTSIILYLYFKGGGDLYYTYFIFLENGNPLNIPDYLVLSTIIGVSTIISFFEKNFFLKLIGFCMLLCLILLSGRGPLLGIFFIGLITIYYRFRVSVIRVFQILALFIFISINYETIYEWSGLDRITQRFSVTTSSKDDNLSVLVRLNDITRSKNLFMTHPFFGLGLGSYSIALNGVDGRSYPHNMFFEVLIEQGIIGFILLIISLYSVFFKMIPILLRSQNTMYFVISSIVIFETLNALKSSSIIDHRFLFAMIALSIISFKYAKSKTILTK